MLKRRLSIDYLLRFLAVRKTKFVFLNLFIVLVKILLLPLVGIITTTLIIMASPFVRIRVARINSERIGHFLMEYDWYTSAVLEPHLRNSLDLFFFSSRPCNTFLEAKWTGRATVLSPWVLNPAYLFLRIFKRAGKKHLVPLPVRPTSFTVLDSLPSAVSFTNREISDANKALKHFNIHPADRIVCLFVRDSAYQQAIENKQVTDYASYRDSNIHDYISSINFLIR
jgi:hypothetical protein